MKTNVQCLGIDVHPFGNFVMINGVWKKEKEREKDVAD
jgi:hypothetical protein